MNKLHIGIFLFVVIFCIFGTCEGKKRKAHLAQYESYFPNDKECFLYNGCTRSDGRFTFVEGKMPVEWVRNNNIISIHQKDAGKYKLKKFKITQGKKSIVATVYDACDDRDCEGCCTRNAKSTGFMIRMEKYTFQRFGGKEGKVEWECIDC